MLTAWIVAKMNPQLVEAFQNAGWQIEVFAPTDFVPASQLRVAPDPIVFEAVEPSLFDKYRQICRDKIAPVLVIVASWTFADAILEAGADEVMAGPVNPIELLFRGTRLVRASKIVRVGDLVIDLAVQAVKLGGCVIRLSSIEFRLLTCLAEHIGQVVSHDTILFEAFGGSPERGGTSEQVKSAVKRLRQKIEPDPHHPQYIRWGRDPKEATIGHELGHVLGLGEVEWVADSCMLMLSSETKSYDYCGVVRPTSKDASSVP